MTIVHRRREAAIERSRAHTPSPTGKTPVGPSARVAPLWLAIIIAAAGGVVLTAAFPDQNIWPLAFLGTAAILFSLVGRSFRSGLLVGLVAGAAFWGVHIFWLTIYLGPVPWLGLAGLEAVFFAIGSAMIAVVITRGPSLWPTAVGRMLVVPALVAALWTAREGLTSVWPYGGFAWGRLALSQSESPFGSLAAWIGFAGLSFVVAFIAALITQGVREVSIARAHRLLAVVAVATIALVFPAWPAPTSGSTRIAAVQGDSDAGLFAQHTAGDILTDHVNATVPVLDEDVDMVVWPENASDIDPTRSSQSAAVLDAISRRMDAPIVVGTITQPEDGVFYNSSLLWKAGEGATAVYDKIHPVPFAEYMPNREFFRALAPDLVDLVPKDYSIGTRPNTFDINGIIAGIAICFDITDDTLSQEMVDGGAQIILAQTNNADFGRTEESVQQLAIARLRAIETGRSVVNISTVGSSAIIAPDGSTIDSLKTFEPSGAMIDSLKTFEPGAMVDTVPLSTTMTPALVLGRNLEWFLSALAVLAFFAVVVTTRRTRDGRSG